MRKIVFYSLLAIFTTLLGCSKSNESTSDFTAACEAIEGPLEVLSTLNESKQFIPYPDSTKILVYSDSLGNEYVGKVIMNRTVQRVTIGKQKCPLDDNILIGYKWEREIDEFVISFESLDLNVNIRVSPGWVFNVDIPGDIIVSDYCHATLYSTNQDSTSPSNGSIIIDVNPRGNPRPNRIYSQVHDSLTIQGDIFTNVYVSLAKDFNWLNYDMFYNMDLGLLAFRDSDNLELFYKIERVE